MNSDDSKKQYYQKVIQILQTSGFQIMCEVVYKNQSFDYIANRKRLQVEAYGFSNTFYFFSKISSPEISNLRKYSNECFTYALSKGGIHPPRGVFYGVFCFPVAIVDSISAETADLIRTAQPPKHWAAFETLVVLSLESKNLYYCEITPAWGRPYYDAMRQNIRDVLAP